jgi:GTP-binding protein
MSISFSNARFITGAHQLVQCPSDVVSEVAVAGRSNAGKSSALNAITGNKGLARTSKQPGRTQQINFFELGEKQFLVDLPGYGYAKVPPKLRQHWDQTLSAYFETRTSLKGLVVIMDVRHPLKDLDCQLIEWANHIGIPIHCLLTKADKLRSGQNAASLQRSRQQLSEMGSRIGVQLFSAYDLRGVDEARQVIADWLTAS